MYTVGFRLVMLERPQIINLNFVTITEIFRVRKVSSLIMMTLLQHSMSIVDTSSAAVVVVVAEIRGRRAGCFIILGGNLAPQPMSLVALQSLLCWMVIFYLMILALLTPGGLLIRTTPMGWVCAPREFMDRLVKPITARESAAAPPISIGHHTLELLQLIILVVMYMIGYNLLR